ncbi:MAG: hypothetical protein GX579_15165 [Chloroflexi bacterium]|nr:hypothetical protein [Chloroflexota bacterium]
MKRILLVEPDEGRAARLFEILLSSGEYVISAASTVLEATLLLGRQRQDLVLLPVELLHEALPALRDRQPDLAVVALAPPGVLAAPELAGDQVQGILPRGAAEAALPGILGEILGREGTAPAAPPVEDDAEQLAATLQGATLHAKVIGALVSCGGELRAHTGRLEPSQVQDVAAHVANTWMPGHTAAIQFLRLPTRSGDLLLYTRPLGSAHLLTLAARPETALGELRRQADALYTALVPHVAADDARAPVPAGRHWSLEEPPTSYAVVWRAHHSLPLPLQITVRRVLERLASERGFELSHVVVRAELVHFLVHCPPDCRVDEIVRQLKEGVAADLRAQSGFTSRLWEKGFYAVPAAEPLGEHELAPFLQQAP